MSSIGELVRVPAHEALLIAASKVFEVMFNGQWKETDEVSIPDVMEHEFKRFLRHFYSDRIQLSIEDDNIGSVMSLGHQYKVDACLENCATLLAFNINADNVCDIMDLAMRFSHEILFSESSIFISLNTIDVFNSDGFLNCKKEVLSQILRLNSMDCTEVRVFEACMDWVKTISRQNVLTKELVKEHLGNLLFDIRLGSLSIDQANQIIEAEEQLFTESEVKKIRDMIKLKKKNWAPFNGEPRSDALTMSATLTCNMLDGAPINYCFGSTENVTFSVYKTVLLKTIDCSNVCESNNIPEDLRNTEYRADIVIPVFNK